MPTLRALPLASLAPATLCLVVVACSSSNGNTPGAPGDAGAPADAGSDAGSNPIAVDAPLGPVFCGLPVPATCPTTAPCTAGGWGCAQAAACDGYFVVTDGTWVYYYSLPGGDLAGEVAQGDAALVSCPYGFIPPSCTPVVALDCEASDASDASDAAAADAASEAEALEGSVGDGGPEGSDAAASVDGD